MLVDQILQKNKNLFFEKFGNMIPIIETTQAGLSK